MRFRHRYCWLDIPRPERAARRTRRAAGFTLLEVLMVLGLLVIITSLSLPSLQRPLANQRLTGAAKQLRVALAKTRLAAIESGEAQQFRFVVGEARYRVGADEVLLPHDDTQAGSDDTGPRLTQGGNKLQRAAGPQMATGGEHERWQEFRLPETVRFAATGIEEPLEQLTLVTDQQAADQALSDDLDAAAWSPPIVFQPDGSATDANITLVNERRMQIVVTVRGLTGAARIGSMEPVEDEQLLAEPAAVAP